MEKSTSDIVTRTLDSPVIDTIFSMDPYLHQLLQENFFSLLGIAAICYLIGTCPFGSIVAWCKGVDLSTTGSGNPGATNVARSVGKFAGLLVLLLDLGKGFIAAFCGKYLAMMMVSLELQPFLARDLESIGLAAGFFAVAGHCISIPLPRIPYIWEGTMFRGGKGVAPSLGVIMATSGELTLICLVTFIGIFTLTRRVSAASLTAAVAFLAATYLMEYSTVARASAWGMTLLVVIKHYQNIARLMRGTEPAFTFKKTGA